jgi:hypothetical protein
MSHWTITETDNTAVIETPSDEVIIAEGETGPQGATGPQGPQGPPGVSGDKNFTQAFSSATSVTVDHNLGKFPAVSVFDTAGDEIIGDVDHETINQLIITFGVATSGTVVCN